MRVGDIFTIVTNDMVVRNTYQNEPLFKSDKVVFKEKIIWDGVIYYRVHKINDVNTTYDINPMNLKLDHQ
jgi:hypothetical protein